MMGDAEDVGRCIAVVLMAAAFFILFFLFTGV
jgi:hypothetical protein